MTSNQLVFFDKVHANQVSGVPKIIWFNDYNVLLTRDEEEKVDVERGVYEKINELKKSTFKYEKEGQLFIGVAKVEIKEYGTTKRKRCTVFDYTGNKIFTIYALQKRYPERIRKNKEAYFLVITMGGPW